MTRRLFVSVVMVVAFAAVCLGGLGFIAVNMGLHGPWSNEFALNADFAAANGLVPQAEVRVSGVHVGTVLEISDAGDGGALVKMGLQPGIHLRQDVRAVIRPKTMLGEKYVELVRQQSSNQPYLQSGATIPKSQTAQAIEIDDILNAMDAPTRQAMSESFRKLGVALDGRQADVQAALGPLDNTVANLRPLARVGESRQQELDRILTNLNIIMQALADEQDQLSTIVTSGDTVMSAIASRDQALAGTVQNGASLFSSLDQAFTGVTAADRTSLQKSPATIAAGRRTLALTNPKVDQLLPELLLGQIGYPNDQLNISNSESLILAQEWISGFSQRCDVPPTDCLRIFGGVQVEHSSNQPVGAGGPPIAPPDLAALLLQQFREPPMKLLAAIVAAGALLTGLMTALFGTHTYTITAYFISAEGLTPQNDVVINGSRVGRVDSVSIAPDDGPSRAGAQVVFELDGSAAPLHRGTRAIIRPKGLLGNPFLELQPGPPGAEVIQAAGTLPLQDTASPVVLDQVMDLFDPQTRARIQTLTREGGASLANRGSDLNVFLAALPAIMQDTAAVTGKIAQQDQQLSALDVEFDRIAQMMASEDQAFRRDLSNGASLLDVTAAHEQQLQAELVYADRALGKLASGLKGHERDLNEMLRAMPSLLDELQSLSDHSATSLAVLDPCMADIIQTIAEMRSAQSYRDAAGNLLRVHPYVFPGTDTVNPARLACSGG